MKIKSMNLDVTYRGCFFIKNNGTKAGSRQANVVPLFIITYQFIFLAHYTYLCDISFIMMAAEKTKT